MTSTRAALAVLLVLVLSACSASFSIGGLSEEDLLTEIQTTADEAEPDAAPWEATCDGAFPDTPESGDTFECSVTSSDGSATVPVAVELDDEGASFTIGG